MLSSTAYNTRRPEVVGLTGLYAVPHLNWSWPCEFQNPRLPYHPEHS